MGDFNFKLGAVAQLVEHLPEEQGVGGSNPPRTTNKVIVPRVSEASLGLKKSKVTDGCVTPWVIMINNDTSLPKFAK